MFVLNISILQAQKVGEIDPLSGEGVLTVNDILVKQAFLSDLGQGASVTQVYVVSQNGSYMLVGDVANDPSNTVAIGVDLVVGEDQVTLGLSGGSEVHSCEGNPCSSCSLETSTNPDAGSRKYCYCSDGGGNTCNHSVTYGMTVTTLQALLDNSNGN